jgi:hypothetical protein
MQGEQLNPPLGVALRPVVDALRLPWSLVPYVAFAAVVYLAQGRQPTLGADHLTYIQMADAIRAACPDGDYWREVISIRTFSVLLAYLSPITGSHVASMKLVLAVFTVLYLLCAELFFALFARERWQAVLFAVVSCFAVSFGVSSWGMTDSTALLPRTLVAPVLMAAMWLWMREPESARRYLAFPLLVLASVLHLSTFYLAAVLLLVEMWDWFAGRKATRDRVLALAGVLAASTLLLFALEYAGLSMRVIGVKVPQIARSVGLDVPNLAYDRAIGCPLEKEKGLLLGRPALSPTVPARRLAGVLPSLAAAQSVAAARQDTAAVSAREAWEIELRLRPWRNMPLPLVNVLNAVSSSALILLIALGGIWTARRYGFTRADRTMAAMLVAVPALALVPQTILWMLRSRFDVYPVTLEEIRAVSLVMIPALYFAFRLFLHVSQPGRAHAAAAGGAVVVGVLALPIFMKSLPASAREQILSAMSALHVVDRERPSSVINARTALGLASTTPLYYASENVRRWLALNTPPGARILTTQDDLILVPDRVILGTRQSLAMAFYVTQAQTQLFLDAAKAVADGDSRRLLELAIQNRADFVVVPWKAADAIYSDEHFSVLRVPRG